MLENIKFRGKSRETNEWVYGQLLRLAEQPFIVGDLVEANSEYTHLEWWEPVFIESLGRYTGVKDSKSKEIYEGDILKVTIPEKHIPNYDCSSGLIDYDTEDGSEHLGVVKYNVDSFEYDEIKTLKGEKQGMYGIPVSYLENTEVVGNIYENSELIKEGL